MAGAIVTSERGARRALDAEINMIPMIDLLMVTISFLLITAVWTHLSRVDASAMVPGTPSTTPPPHAAPRLHVEMRDPERFVLHWNDGATVVRTRDVPRRDMPASEAGLRFAELASALDEEWRAAGSHKDAGDRDLDELVLHTSDDTPYGAIIGAIDAAYQVKRVASARRASAPEGERIPAFRVTFATH